MCFDIEGEGGTDRAFVREARKLAAQSFPRANGFPNMGVAEAPGGVQNSSEKPAEISRLCSPPLLSGKSKGLPVT